MFLGEAILPVQTVDKLCQLQKHVVSTLDYFIATIHKNHMAIEVLKEATFCSA